MNGFDLLGADNYTDAGTVLAVQMQLHALAKAKKDATLDPGKLDGKVGPNTNRAVAAFNTQYGWSSDGDAITAGTLEALKRPDVRALTGTGSVDFAEGDTINVTRPAPAAPSAPAAAAKPVAPSAPPAAVTATAATAPAAPAAQVKAIEQVRAVDSKPNFFLREYAGIPVYGWGAIGGGAIAGITLLSISLRRVLG